MFEFTQESITQIVDNQTKTWSFAELLEKPDPLYGEPLAERNAVMRKMAEMAETKADQLSEMAQLKLDFWKNFRPEKISKRTFLYSKISVQSYQWELTINELGIFYKDLSGEYDSRLGWGTEQLFSDFWFYGPQQPIPDLRLREKVVGILRDALSRSDCPAAGAHFELFEYPELGDKNLYWQEGNHVRTDFVKVCKNGIEIGHWTFRDSQPGAGFLSFERFLHEPQNPHSGITPEIRAEIERFLGKKSTLGLTTKAEPLPPAAPTPLDRMDSAESLLKSDPKSELGAKTLIGLLEFEAETDYFRNYVFNYCFKLRGNRTIESFIIEKLQGDNEIHFKKAVDVLGMWGFYGDKAFADRDLLLKLNWNDATANDPDFRDALEKAIKIIG